MICYRAPLCGHHFLGSTGISPLKEGSQRSKWGGGSKTLRLVIHYRVVFLVR